MNFAVPTGQPAPTARPGLVPVGEPVRVRRTRVAGALRRTGLSLLGGCLAAALVAGCGTSVPGGSINPAANAGGPYAGFAGSPISFTAAATRDPQGESLTYSWDFGDGGTAAGVTTTHTYANAGTYTVAVKATDRSQRVGTATAQAVIQAVQTTPVPLGKNGVVYGGQQPVASAAVQLWQVGDAGYGAGATPLGSSVPTDSGGFFVLTGAYSCSNAVHGPDTLVYVTATGGNPGVSAGTNNTALAMMTALGRCGNLTPTTYLSINEVTTVASVYALAQFMNASGGVGSYASSTAGLVNAFATVNNLVNTGNGAALTRTPGGNGIVPQAKINTLANILAACVNSSGPSSPGCSALFSTVAPIAGAAPTTTIGAALAIALSPGTRPTDLLNLQMPTAPFAPSVSSVNDWTLTLGYASGGTAPAGVALDGAGDVWVPNYGSGGATSSVSLLNAAGVPAANNPYTASGAVNGAIALAIDPSNNAWVANRGNNSALELNSTGSGSSLSVGTAGGPYTGITLNAPQAVAVDGAANVWFVNAGNSSLTELAQGSYSTGTAVTGIGLNTPKAIAFDNLGDAWVANSTGGSVTELNPGVTPRLFASFPAPGLSSPSSVAIDAGGDIWLTDASSNAAAELNHGGAVLSPAAGFTGGGLTAANASAIDGSGSFWVADALTGAVSVRNAAGLAVTPSTGYQDASLSTPSGLAIDASGNVWVSNLAPVTQSGQTLTVSEIVGAASPVVVPLSAALAGHALGQKPGSPQTPLASPGGPYAGLVTVPIAFSAAGSLDPRNETLTYAWNFGDGALGSGLTPTHSYSAAGHYAATLTVTDADGLTGTIQAGVTVLAAPATLPTVNAGGPYTGTTAAAISFDGTGTFDPSQQSQGAIGLTLVWGFGDGASGYGATPVHTYAAAGTYTVTLTATTASGGTASGTATVTITQGTVPAGTPAANVNGPYTGTVGKPVQFSNAGSSDPNSRPLTYRWDFGDGASLLGANPTHTYLSMGTFSVTLTVTNGDQLTTVSTIATISAAPAVALVASVGGPYTAALNQVVQFNGSATTNPNNGLLNFTWDFGDGSTGTGAQPYHVYTRQGTFKVNLNVTDGVGPAGNANTQLTVGPAPAEAITASTGGPYANAPNQAIPFDGSGSRDNLSYPLTYSWSFGDGATATGLNPTHAYAAEGTYTVSVTATSGTASGTASSTVTITPNLNVVITSPASGALLAVNTATVSGTVSVANAKVTVNGVTAQVSGNSFTAAGVGLREGVNLLTAAATSGAASGNGTVSVVVDLTPPGIAINSPANNSSVSQSNITVAGLVNDIVTGTVSSNQVSVTVNGQASPVSNRSFALSNVLLTPGANIITAVATDTIGNTTRASINVNYVPPTQQLSLQVVSGDGQTGAVKSVLPQPLVVQLLSASGTPVAGRPVTFTVSRSDGMVEVMPTVAQSLSVITDAAGKASTLFLLGSRQGLAINQVTASTPGAGGTATLMASTTAAAPTQIHAVRGENQRGLLGEPLAEAFQIIVTDAYANPSPGVTVNFTSTAGDGTLDHASAVTDSNGKAKATLTLGQQEGTNNYIVTADFSGDTGTAPRFIASAFAAGPAANTSVSGVVLDNANTPIPNATVRLQGTTLSTVSDSNGVFSIPGAPVGTVTMTVDGSTSTSTHSFPFLSFVLEDLPGVNNTLNKPIYLPFIDVNGAQTVGGNDPVTLTIKGVPGVAFTVAPNSVTFPDGSNVGQLSLSQVKSDMVPMIPTNGSAPDLIWTLQPAGTKFNPPIQVTVPNTQGLAPGLVSEFYQFDHDLEQFVSAGTAHVSADGSVMVSDAGFGISKAGWGHGPTLPLPPNCQISCDDHNVCTQDVIVPPPNPPGGCPSCEHLPLTGGACGAGSGTKDSASCRESGHCQNGACIAPFLQNGTPCDNGIFCDMPEACQNGTCTGTPIPSVSGVFIPGALLKFEQAFDAGIKPLFLAVGKLNFPISIEPTFTPAGNLTDSCCEAKKLLDSKQITGSLDASLKFSTAKIPLPPPFDLFYVPFVGSVGLYIAGQVNVGGSITYNYDNCADKDCFEGGPYASIQLEGGILAAGAGGEANVGLNGGGKVGVTVGCKKVTFDVGLLPLNLVVGYTNPLTKKTGSLEIPLIPASDLGAVSYPLN